jgi:REP element-mobilizing transposase RayT
MNRGGSRQKVDKQDYEAFLKTIGEIHDRWAVEVFAYCIMGNHYHVCLRTPEGNLPRLKALCGEISSALPRINCLGELARRLALRL